VAGGAAELPVAGRGVRPHRDVAVIHALVLHPAGRWEGGLHQRPSQVQMTTEKVTTSDHLFFRVAHSHY
jgi:hypothetical protein